MSAVLQFPTTPRERREIQTASEVSKLAGMHGYGLRAVQQFQRDAVRMAERLPHLTPSACAARSVPPKSVGIGDAWDGDGPEAA